MTELTGDQAAVLRDLRGIQSVLEKVRAIEEERKAELRALGTGRYTIDGVPVLDVLGGASFDATTAVDALTSTELLSILVPRPDAKAAQRVLSGERYAACQKPKALAVKLLSEKGTDA